MHGNFQEPRLLLMGEMYFNTRQLESAFRTLATDELSRTS